MKFNVAPHILFLCASLLFVTTSDAMDYAKAKTAVGPKKSVHMPDSFFTKAATNDPQAKVLARGDLNGDGYEDAIVQEVTCGASCRVDAIIVLNKKNIRVKRLDGVDYFAGFVADGALKTELTHVMIKNGIITLVGKGFENLSRQGDPTSWGENGLEKAQYRLIGNKVKLINIEKVK